MGKALLVQRNTAGISGNEMNFGGQGAGSTESWSQLLATEDFTLSNLGGRIVSGNSGTATDRIRKNGGNGNSVITITGVDADEDVTNTDSFATSDLMNLSHADTGTNGTFQWIKANIEFAAGHGNIHMAGQFNNGAIQDVDGSTRFQPFQGTVESDGWASEADAEWMFHAYDEIEAIIVRVTANARSSDSVYTLRVNGADEGSSITFSAAETGIKAVIGMGVAVSPGDRACLKQVLGAGAGEDFRVSIIAVVMKSSAGSSESFTHADTPADFAASVTEQYAPIGGNLGHGFVASESDCRIRIGFAARCRRLGCLIETNTLTGDAELGLYVNGTRELVQVIEPSEVGFVGFDTTHFDIDDAAEASFSIVGGTSGNVSFRAIGIAFDPIAAEIGSATEASTAQPMGRSKTRAIGLTAEADESLSTGRTKARALGLVTESEVSHGVAVAKSRALGLVAEANTAQAVAPAKWRLIGLATEADIALPVSTPSGGALGIASETDAAQPIGRTKQRAIAATAEGDSALAFARAKVRALGAPTEADAALPVGRAKSAQLGIVSEIAAALAIGRSKQTPIGGADEIDLALPFFFSGVAPVPGRLTVAAAAARAGLAAKANRVGLVSTQIGKIEVQS